MGAGKIKNFTTGYQHRSRAKFEKICRQKLRLDARITCFIKNGQKIVQLLNTSFVVCSKLGVWELKKVFVVSEVLFVSSWIGFESSCLT